VLFFSKLLMSSEMAQGKDFRGRPRPFCFSLGLVFPDFGVEAANESSLKFKIYP
jgi:hypothetical protein